MLKIIISILIVASQFAQASEQYYFECSKKDAKINLTFNIDDEYSEILSTNTAIQSIEKTVVYYSGYRNVVLKSYNGRSLVYSITFDTIRETLHSAVFIFGSDLDSDSYVRMDCIKK